MVYCFFAWTCLFYQAANLSLCMFVCCMLVTAFVCRDDTLGLGACMSSCLSVYCIVSLAMLVCDCMPRTIIDYAGMLRTMCKVC